MGPCDYLSVFNDNNFFLFSFRLISRPIQISKEKYSQLAARINFSCLCYHFHSVDLFEWNWWIQWKTWPVRLFLSLSLSTSPPSHSLLRFFLNSNHLFHTFYPLGRLMNGKLWFHVLWLKNQRLNNVLSINSSFSFPSNNFISTSRSLWCNHDSFFFPVQFSRLYKWKLCMLWWREF